MPHAIALMRGVVVVVAVGAAVASATCTTAVSCDSARDRDTNYNSLIYRILLNKPT